MVLDRGRPVTRFRCKDQQCWIRATSGMQQGPGASSHIHICAAVPASSSAFLVCPNDVRQYCDLPIAILLPCLAFSKCTGCMLSGWCSGKHELHVCPPGPGTRRRRHTLQPAGTLCLPDRNQRRAQPAACGPVFLVHHIAATFIQLSRGLLVLIRIRISPLSRCMYTLCMQIHFFNELYMGRFCIIACYTMAHFQHLAFLLDPCVPIKNAVLIF